MLGKGMPIVKEKTTLKSTDCFTIFFRTRNSLDFPVHFHGEYELTLLLNAAGAKRVIGDFEETVTNFDLVLMAPNLVHGWIRDECKNDEITHVTIQWHEDLFDVKFLQRSELYYLKNMFERSSRGLAFSRDTILKISPRILALKSRTGFDALTEIMSILHELSLSIGSVAILHELAEDNLSPIYADQKIKTALRYMNECFQQEITLSDVAKMVNMTEVGFSRFIRKRTGKTFTESLTEIRLSHAARILIETAEPIARICAVCGFRNLSNFNRIFKRLKGRTPREYRSSFNGHRLFV